MDAAGQSFESQHPDAESGQNVSIVLRLGGMLRGRRRRWRMLRGRRRCVRKLGRKADRKSSSGDGEMSRGKRRRGELMVIVRRKRHGGRRMGKERGRGSGRGVVRVGNIMIDSRIVGGQGHGWIEHGGLLLLLLRSRGSG